MGGSPHEDEIERREREDGLVGLGDVTDLPRDLLGPHIGDPATVDLHLPLLEREDV